MTTDFALVFIQIESVKSVMKNPEFWARLPLLLTGSNRDHLWLPPAVGFLPH